MENINGISENEKKISIKGNKYKEQKLIQRTNK